MIIDSGLSLQEHKAIKFFSSGMKQRLKLVLAIYADTPLLLLDEPCSNLDNQGIEWYRKLIHSQLKHRTIIIASNQLLEYDFCDRTVSILDFK
jgi:ABC-type multidrug transport system ATPase subunit